MTIAMQEVSAAQDAERRSSISVLGAPPLAGGQSARELGSLSRPRWTGLIPWFPIALACAGVAAYFLLDHLGLLAPSLRDRPWPFEIPVLAACLHAAATGLRRRGRARVAAMVTAGVTLSLGVALTVVGGYLRHVLPPTPTELAAGRTLPRLTALDERGREVELSSSRNEPTVILVYRSTFCSSCSAQLHGFAAQARPFLDAGVRVLAISPDPPEVAAALRERAGIPFPVLSDPYQTATAVLCSGGSHCELLLDGRGVVRWGAFSDNWREIPQPRTVLQAGYRLL